MFGTKVGNWKVTFLSNFGRCQCWLLFLKWHRLVAGNVQHPFHASRWTCSAKWLRGWHQIEDLPKLKISLGRGGIFEGSDCNYMSFDDNVHLVRFFCKELIFQNRLKSMVLVSCYSGAWYFTPFAWTFTVSGTCTNLPILGNWRWDSF